MIEHQSSALLVGIVIGYGAVTRIRHIRDVLEADAFGKGGYFTGRCDPLMRGTVTDPGGATAMQMDDGTILGIAGAGIVVYGVITW
jgi:hypothetical protein